MHQRPSLASRGAGGGRHIQADLSLPGPEEAPSLAGCTGEGVWKEATAAASSAAPKPVGPLVLQDVGAGAAAEPGTGRGTPSRSGQGRGGGRARLGALTAQAEAAQGQEPFPVRGWGRLPGSPTPSTEPTREPPAFRAPTPRSPGRGCASLSPFPEPARGALLPALRRLCPTPGTPASGPLRVGDGARARRPPLPSLRGLLRLQRAPSTRGGEGTGARSQPRCARVPHSARRRPGFAAREMGPGRTTGQLARERLAAAHSPPPS